MKSLLKYLLALLAIPAIAQAQPNASFDHAFLADPGCFSLETSYLLQLRTTNPAGNKYHQWSVSDKENFGLAGSLSSAPLLTVNYLGRDLPSQIDVTLVVEDSTGATDTLTKTIELNLHLAPVVKFSPEYALSGCAPFGLEFTSHVLSPQGNSISTYFWEFGDGKTSNSASTSNVYESEGQYNVKLTVTDDQGCSSDNSTFMLPTTVTVEPAGNCE